jgi:hypothetical protein
MFDPPLNADQELIEDLKDIEESETKGYVTPEAAEILVSEAYERFYLRQ